MSQVQNSLTNDSQRTDVLFYVQHLLGIGHQKRAATLARAMERQGLKVTFVSGGMSVPGLNTGSAKFVQLPPLRAEDIHFRRLVDEQGQEADDGFKAERRAQLLSVFEQERPRALLIEMFPFGRRQMRFELRPLLESAHAAAHRPLILSSVRDILVEPPKRERIAEMIDWIQRVFDFALVHGDPDLIPFDETFPPLHEIADQVVYTGYVVDESVDKPPHPSDGIDEILVSTGGGAVSEALVTAALAASQRLPPALAHLKDCRWRILIGHSLPEVDFQAFKAQARDNVMVQRSRPDFTSLLPNCRLSISQGGYNTVMEVLRAGCPRVIVPYSGGLETEQTLRARLFAGRDALTLVEEQDLTADSLLQAIAAEFGRSGTSRLKLDTDGARNTAKRIESLLSDHENGQTEGRAP
ncbi:glycosyltransferase family protein [Pelagibius sp. Alg239-R121]|uniref:glycosyltransferase family protein n=1 Tax=Pelagibius sp. Alg239-R121 TaxID=2993448 RepID=UPI0024A70966|nr:glycosyltransferase [Pelagibius sp. Alg239-R121]